jgi:hypothetical protein
MLVTYKNDSVLNPTANYLTFGPTGKVDEKLTLPNDFNDAKRVLTPTIQYINTLPAVQNIPNFDFWELLNWMFVTQYWALLLDFGQIAPSTFNYNTN